MQAVLSEASLAQLQQVLRPELAKELAAATIARDDTVASLKKEKQQRRRYVCVAAGRCLGRPGVVCVYACVGGIWGGQIQQAAVCSRRAELGRLANSRQREADVAVLWGTWEQIYPHPGRSHTM
jgi:hypothetical protein